MYATYKLLQIVSARAHVSLCSLQALCERLGIGFARTCGRLVTPLVGVLLRDWRSLGFGWGRAATTKHAAETGAHHVTDGGSDGDTSAYSSVIVCFKEADG